MGIACERGAQNLRYITEHKQAFDVEYVYPLDIFERFAETAQGWGLECSCKIQKDQLYPARFNVSRNTPTVEHYMAVLQFFRQVETRVDVTLDYGLMERFVGSNFDFRKVVQILVGVDLRRDVSTSRLKFWFVMHDYPEKLALAMTLCGASKALRTLLVADPSGVVGFDFFLNGRSAIELYPSCNQEAWQRTDVQQRLAAVLSPPALRLLDGCWSILIGFSTANPDKVLYYRPHDPNPLIATLRHDIAKRVQAYYRGQPVLGTIVGLQEREVQAGFIQNISLYYQMS